MSGNGYGRIFDARSQASGDRGGGALTRAIRGQPNASGRSSGEDHEGVMTINLKMPEIQELRPKITVFGVGGAGGNAVNNMIRSGLLGCEFVVANTDSQALSSSRSERLIQMGVAVTEGLGAGS